MESPEFQHKQSAGPEPIDPNDDCLKVPAPGIDDLAIRDREGNHFYWVKKCEYQNDGHKLDRFDPILEEQVRLLTNQGVVIADVPGGSFPGLMHGFHGESERYPAAPCQATAGAPPAGG